MSKSHVLPGKKSEHYRWKEDATGIEFKCCGCGHWKDFDQASGLIATDGAPSCKACIDLMMSSIRGLTP